VEIKMHCHSVWDTELQQTVPSFPLDEQPLECSNVSADNLPWAAVVAQRCARLHVPDPRTERSALIAATALVHGLTVVTRNVADFGPTGVSLIDPWQAQ
jgi:predicted nucleic acid-binding protein